MNAAAIPEHATARSSCLLVIPLRCFHKCALPSMVKNNAVTVFLYIQKGDIQDDGRR